MTMKALKGLLTTSQMCELFDVTSQTITNWRRKGLPCVRIPGNRKDGIRFRPSEVLRWAKKNGKKISSDSSVA